MVPPVGAAFRLRDQTLQAGRSTLGGNIDLYDERETRSDGPSIPIRIAMAFGSLVP
jgi:hypothetical protein